MNALTEAIPDSFQQKALTTWYQPSDPRYLDPRHPLIKLAGEAGEILDLFGKEEYKPGFDWWDCKYCGNDAQKHEWRAAWDKNGIECRNYTPLVLDELGDYWYYLRILTWQQGISIENWVKELEILNYNNPNLTILYCLSTMAKDSSEALYNFVEFDTVSINGLIWNSFVYFLRLLKILDCTLDRLTELNYQKLNSEPSAHGWKVRNDEKI